ncbi:DegT/DnrJ/EryC1/StrS family aminotransferase [Aliihoeflea sp. PC F10.4]
MTIAFIDLAAQQKRLRSGIDNAVAKVLDEGKYIMGPQVAEFERQLAAFCGAGHALSCANGTDALQLALMALGVKEGDAVFVPAFTFAATAEIVPFVNATPIFVDVDPRTFNMDAESLKRAIGHAKELGLRPACVIPVDLFGLPADYDTLIAIAREEKMHVVGDSAQGFAADYKGRRTGSICDVSTTSFFPAKPLGCYGDGGAVFTNDPQLAALIDSFRVHGKGTDKYNNDRLGLNSRLDTLQAAILLEKLAIYGEEIETRQKVAKRYDAALGDLFETPYIPDGLTSVWAQYTLKLADEAARSALQARAKEAGVPTMVYYPVPLHKLNAYKEFPRDPKGLAVSEDLATRVVSLPMHPYLDDETQDTIIGAVRG